MLNSTWYTLLLIDTSPFPCATNFSSPWTFFNAQVKCWGYPIMGTLLAKNICIHCTVPRFIRFTRSPLIDHNPPPCTTKGFRGKWIYANSFNRRVVRFFSDSPVSLPVASYPRLSSMFLANDRRDRTQKEVQSRPPERQLILTALASKNLIFLPRLWLR